ncbi:MAG: RNase adapter RapZ [Acidimicrobiia bacterium]|nr:RNase adapter RapZ [Acidimicrobiia bacterium]
MREFIVITGMSGAGRSLAADTLEDLGWYVIDNLPPALIPPLLDQVDEPDQSLDRVALVLGVGKEHSKVRPALELLRDTKVPVTVVFLEARPRVLVQRYEGVRRRHPLDDGSGLEDAIAAEAASLETVRSEADLVIDTSDFNVHALRARLTEYFGQSSPASPIHMRLLSFGYKHGLPLDVDIIFDCRFLPNPHWDDELRPFTGLEAPVAEFLSEQKLAGDFLDHLDGLFDQLVPAYIEQGKSYLTVAFGCTGGRHRSVWMAERVGERLRAGGYDPTVAHRDVAK